MMNDNLSPIDWAKKPLQKYADFSGRAPRSEYWWFVLLQMVVMIFAMLVDSMLGTDVGGTGYGYVYMLTGLALLVPCIAVGVRRLHDTDRFALNEEEIVAGAGLQRRFADSDAQAGERVELLVVLNQPARGGKLHVDQLTGALFRVDVGHGALRG